MSHHLSTERRVKNEQAARDFNFQLLRHAEGFFESLPVKNVGFDCECDVAECQEILSMASETYASLHRNPSRFTVKPGHQKPDIEQVIDRYHGFLVVEKTV